MEVVELGTISVSLPTWLEFQLREESERTGKGISRIVAEALKAYFDEKGVTRDAGQNL